MRPNISATECGGRKRGLRATLIHVSSGQIIYHLVQTNSVLDSLSEEEGGVWGLRGLPATLQSDPHHSSSYLPSSALSSLLLQCRRQALVTILGVTHGGERAVKRSHVFISHFLASFSFCKLQSLLINEWLCTCFTVRQCVMFGCLWLACSGGGRENGVGGGVGGWDLGCIWTLGSRPICLSHP